MAKTSEHIGKVAYMKGGYVHEFIGGSSPEHFEAAGLTFQKCASITDSDGVMHHFYEIVGECDPDMFTAILTKAEANAKILFLFTPTIETTCSSFYIQEYIRRFIPDSVFSELDDEATTDNILAALKASGCKFIRMSKYDGYLFDEA